MNTAFVERPGTPVNFTAGFKPLKPKIARAIEQLGELNDRHNAALAAGDAQALIEIAAEYLMVGSHGGCPRMSAQILAEADRL